MQLQEKMVLAIIEDLLRNAVKFLKDEEFQKRIWFCQQGPEVSSYSETCLHFLSSYDTMLKYSIYEEFLGTQNYALLKKLYELIDYHFGLTEERIDPDLLLEQELLDDPNWHDIQSLAEEVYLKLTQFCKEKRNAS